MVFLSGRYSSFRKAGLNEPGSPQHSHAVLTATHWSVHKGKSYPGEHEFIDLAT